MTIWISWKPPLFIFEHLDISWASHIRPSQKLWPFEFFKSFCVQFQLSRYIMCMNQHPCEMVWRFEFLESLRCSFASVSICHGPHTCTRVKRYGRLNLPSASVFNIDCLDILCTSIGHPSEKLWPLKYLESLCCSFSRVLIDHGPHTYTRVKSYDHLNLPRAFVFNFDRLDILCTSIGHPSENLWPF